MYFVIAGGGEVGYHLAKGLIESGHEIMIIERDRRRARIVFFSSIVYLPLLLGLLMLDSALRSLG